MKATKATPEMVYARSPRSRYVGKHCYTVGNKAFQTSLTSLRGVQTPEDPDQLLPDAPEPLRLVPGSQPAVPIGPKLEGLVSPMLRSETHETRERFKPIAPTR